MTATDKNSSEIEERGPQTFSLTVTFEGQRFDLGTYINRAEAMKAGKLFLDRKEGEKIGRKKHPRKKS